MTMTEKSIREEIEDWFQAFDEDINIGDRTLSTRRNYIDRIMKTFENRIDKLILRCKDDGKLGVTGSTFFAAQKMAFEEIKEMLNQK